MATSLHGARANVHCRKRSFEIAIEPEPSLPIEPRRHLRHGPSPRSMTFPVTPADLCAASKRRLRTTTHVPGMPVHTPSVMSISYPSFMSVYGSDEGTSRIDFVETPQLTRKEQTISLQYSNNHTASHIIHNSHFPIHHRASTASLTTTSTASSPTTTHSSPMFTDPSPASSPESASSNPPLSLFTDTMQHSNHDRSQNGDQTYTSLATPSNLQTSSESPVNSSKNPKNLTINMNNVLAPRPATSTGVDTWQALSEPTSPFKEPLRSARKKPTNLTIRTPIFNQLNFPRTTPDIPPTPSSKPSLQTYQSSPSLLSLATPTTSSSAGLHLSLPSLGNGHSRPGSDSSFSSQSINGPLPGVQEEDEAHKSQESQERGYPDGPVLVYDCGLYLYLEPTAEEASRFDTVINVAKEIKCPFGMTSVLSRSITSVMRADLDRPDVPEPQTAVSEMSFRSAWEYQPLDEATPTVGRPESALDIRQPEYLHVEWDHNSEILQDLQPLCELIDDRTQHGKKVLVHCQLGVSRSASLVIAFGLYKGYQPDFHTMYSQVKRRSRWVGPNMSLIYQLNDFRAKTVRGDYRGNTRPAPSHWFQKSMSPIVRAPFQAMSLNEDTTDPNSEDTAKTPQAVKPLRSIRLDKELPPVPLFVKQDNPQSESHLVNTLAKPTNLSDPDQATASQPSSVARSAGVVKQSVQPRPLPFRKLAEYSNPQAIPPHRPRTNTLPVLQMATLPSHMDLANQDVPQTPSLFSPRATEFLASPFAISKTVGDLAINGPRSARSVRSIGPPTQESKHPSSTVNRELLPTRIDPRSPHQHGSTGEILRHIDDVL